MIFQELHIGTLYLSCHAESTRNLDCAKNNNRLHFEIYIYKLILRKKIDTMSGIILRVRPTNESW